MAPRHIIEVALDLARMPALARTSVLPPIQPNVVEIMRIAARSSEACQAAAAATGQPVETLVNAARFYLQQVLLRPDADSYRILGIQAGGSHAIARSHMRWLLQWLHPDHNSGIDAIYAERVLKAWREISVASNSGTLKSSRSKREPTHGIPAFRLPWIKYPRMDRRRNSWLRRGFAAWIVPAGLAILFLGIWSAVSYLGTDQAAAILRWR